MSKKSWNNGTRELEKIAGAVIFNERYDPNDKAYNRTPEEQKEIDDKIAGFNKNTEEYHEKNPYADPLRRHRRKDLEAEDAEGSNIDQVTALTTRVSENIAQLESLMDSEEVVDDDDLSIGAAATNALENLKAMLNSIV